jgi:hypothetical protein
MCDYTNTRIITFDGKNLFNQIGSAYWNVAFADLNYQYDDNLMRVRFNLAGDKVKQMLIPLSENEFGFDDSDIRLRFELVGDKVIGVYRRLAPDAPEQLLQKRMEPIEDKNAEVTTLVQQFLRAVIDGTLKPEMFTPNFALKIFPDQVKEYAAVLKSLGPQTGIELYERQEQWSRYYVYRLGYGDKHLILRLSLVADNRISDVDFYLE